MSVMEAVKKVVSGKRRGAVITARSLSKLGSRAAIDQALSRLVREGVLLRVGRGAYVAPIKSRFGTYPPEPESIVRSLAKAKRKAIVPHGLLAANRLGLTTQQPMGWVYFTNGQPAVLEVGKNRVELRHAPRWLTMYPHRAAGEAIRAMAYMGREASAETAPRIKEALPSKEWNLLLSAAPALPVWMSEAIRSVAADG